MWEAVANACEHHGVNEPKKPLGAFALVDVRRRVIRHEPSRPHDLALAAYQTINMKGRESTSD